MENVDLISRRDLLERIKKERAYLKARGLYGAEEILTKYLHNIVEDMSPAEIEFPVIKINVSKEGIQKLLEELQKPQRVLVLPEPEVELIRPYGEWIEHEDMLNDYCGDVHYTCSICGAWMWHKTNFCSTCGADMRGERNG